MQLPLSALRRWIPFPEEIGSLSHILTSLGMEVEKWTVEEGDIWITLSLTPNLAHCNSVVGIAKELSAYWRRPLTLAVPTTLPSGEVLALGQNHSSCCPLFCGGWIDGVQISPSSAELRMQVEGFGMRSVNNVVDTLNVLMCELGQPLHGYDADHIQEETLTVRFAEIGETLVTLDGKIRTLDSYTLIVAAPQPVALAGVLGGKESEVTQQTHHLFIESAWFDPTIIRRSAKHQELSTEASYRFERGIDPSRVYPALEEALQRIQQLCGGTISQKRILSGNPSVTDRVVSLRLSRVHRVLGVAIPHDEVVSILQSLDFVHTIQDGVFLVQVPPYRHDIQEEVDLIEEVARFYGYDRLKSSKRPLFRTGELSHSPLYLFEKKVRDQALRLGLQEWLTCDLLSKKEVELVDIVHHQRIAIHNPRSLDQAYLRSSLLPNHLRVVSHNRDHQQSSVAGFEMGRIYYDEKGSPEEKSVMGVTWSGWLTPPYWQEGSQERLVDFFAVKGKIEQLCGGLALPHLSFEPSAHPSFHPYQQAKMVVNEREVGMVGQVHPQLHDGQIPLFYAELDVVALHALSTIESPSMKPLAQFPSSFRDWTFLLRKEASLYFLWEGLAQQPHPKVESVTLRAVYEHESIGTDWKRVTLRFVYRDKEGTLTQTEIDSLHQKMMDQITINIKGYMS